MRTALQPTQAAWAIRPALGVVTAAGLVAVGGDLSHQWHAVSLIYLGLTFSAVYTKWGTRRLRSATLLGQTCGAAAGLWLGSIPHTDSMRIAVIVTIGVLAGTVGGLTPALSAAANMTVIGVVFGEFGQAGRTPSTEVTYYLIGAGLIGIVALGQWPLRRNFPTSNFTRFMDRSPIPRTHTRSETGWSWHSAVLAGLRLGWCLGIATDVTVIVHQHNHSYWIPLTVAVLIRPDASIAIRTLNRLTGTLTGVVTAALLLLVAAAGGQWIIAATAAAAIGFAVAAAPKLYAFTVYGMTCSTLLSACIASVDPAYPALRLADTLLGAIIAIVFGHLLWPQRSRTSPDATRRISFGTPNPAAHLTTTA